MVCIAFADSHVLDENGSAPYRAFNGVRELIELRCDAARIVSLMASLVYPFSRCVAVRREKYHFGPISSKFMHIRERSSASARAYVA